MPGLTPTIDATRLEGFRTSFSGEIVLPKDDRYEARVDGSAGYVDLVLVLVCFGFFGVFAFLSMSRPPA